MNWILNPLARLLRTGDQAATEDRFFTSQHLTDLRLIIAVGLLAVYLVIAIGLPLAVESQWPGHHEPHMWFAAATNFFTFFGPVLAAFGAIFAWAYQTGSARLGVVDLFACEISTLCRVVAVADSVRRYVEKFDQGPHSVQGIGHQFISQENYFPVFESSARDLQTLEARVVINITAFYTYLKALRDNQRMLADLGAEQSGASDGPWHGALRNVIYMLFLGLESARLAITDLVDIEPEREERRIIVLISELEAYRFLYNQFTEEDARHQLIMLRKPGYQDLVPSLCAAVEAGRSAAGSGAIFQWDPASRLLPELRKRFAAAMMADQPQSRSKVAAAA